MARRGAGARTFLSAATPEILRCCFSRGGSALRRFCGQECPRSVAFSSSFLSFGPLLSASLASIKGGLVKRFAKRRSEILVIQSLAPNLPGKSLVKKTRRSFRLVRGGYELAERTRVSEP